MKKILSTVAAAAVLATSGFAGDINFDTDKAYIGAGIGMEMVDVLDSGFALVLNGGVPFMQVGPGTLAVEGEFTYSLAGPSLGDWEWTMMNLGAYTAWKFDINKQFYVKPRVGLVYTSVDLDYSGPHSGYIGSGSDSSIGLSVGVAGGYVINKNWDATVAFNANLSDYDANYLVVGAQYNF